MKNGVEAGFESEGRLMGIAAGSFAVLALFGGGHGGERHARPGLRRGQCPGDGPYDGGHGDQTHGRRRRGLRDHDGAAPSRRHRDGGARASIRPQRATATASPRKSSSSNSKRSLPCAWRCGDRFHPRRRPPRRWRARQRTSPNPGNRAMSHLPAIWLFCGAAMIGSPALAGQAPFSQQAPNIRNQSPGPCLCGGAVLQHRVCDRPSRQYPAGGDPPG